MKAICGIDIGIYDSSIYVLMEYNEKKDKLYITTDVGILRSELGENIYLDSTVDFGKTVPQLKTNGQPLPVTSLNVIDDYLMMGSDAKLFYSRDSVWINYDEPKLKIPSFYVDGLRQSVGFAYSSNSSYKNISFDHPR